MEKHFNLNIETDRWDWVTLWSGKPEEIAICDLEVINTGPYTLYYWIYYVNNPDAVNPKDLIACKQFIRPGHKQRHNGIIVGIEELWLWHESSKFGSLLTAKLFATVRDIDPENPPMASGRQASLKPANTNVATLYTCNVNKKFVATLRAVNQTANEILVNAWLGNNGYTDADLIEYNTPIQGYTVLENSGILMGAGDALYVQTLTTGVSFIVWGLEEAA